MAAETQALNLRGAKVACACRLRTIEQQSQDGEQESQDGQHSEDCIALHVFLLGLQTQY